jgi:integrase/recombinase XerD
MKLTLAVEEYVSRRRSEGSPFVSSEANLRALCRWCGDTELHNLTSARVGEFVNSPHCNAVTRAGKFSAIKCFVEYWSLRDQMPALKLDKPARPQLVREPFIYTRAQVKALLQAAQRCQSPVIHSRTTRMLLLTLYATGCRVGEVFRLTSLDVGLKDKRICFKGNHQSPERCIPIGRELRAALAEYISARETVRSEDDPFFLDRRGEPIKKGRFYECFRSCNTIAGVSSRSDGHCPRLQDLRFSFAVHRIAQSIRRKDDLNRLLPALSTYMGYSNLMKSEQFLAYAPDRFREDLRKLSPAKGSRHWRNNLSLMDQLQRL